MGVGATGLFDFQCLIIKGQFGKVQVFLLRGETPMLCGRPIIEALGIDIGFAKRRYRFDEGHWQDALLGLHGEYVLPLTTDYDSRLWNGNPSFVTNLISKVGIVGYRIMVFFRETQMAQKCEKVTF